MYRSASLILLVFVVQSCSVAKRYERTTPVEEASFRSDEISVDTTTIARVPWRTFFTDPLLILHIDEALQNNIDIRIALENINAAQAIFKNAKAELYPSLGAGLSYGYATPSVVGQDGNGVDRTDLSEYSVDAFLSWELDIWGKLRSQQRAGQASYLQSLAAHQAVKSELIAELASTYYLLLALDRQQEILEQTIINREKAVETTGILKESGSLTNVAVKQTEAILWNARDLLIDVKNSIRLLENRFQVLKGEVPGPVERSTLAEQTINTDLAVGVPIQLLSNRPDIIAAEQELINRFELANVAKTRFYPSLTLNAAGGLQSLSFDDLFSTNALFAEILAGLTQPIFNKRRIRSDYEISLAENEKAFQRYKLSVLNASREVSDALYTYRAFEEKIYVKEQENKALTEALEQSRELLVRGIVNYLEVLRATDSLLNGRLSLVLVQYGKLEALTILYRSLGGGWE